ncbi:MAG TPA: cupin domain-containing protein, partial [Kiritimatiellia bacterium]|nr:cupin domain-containing protein [Kiritimatiellia bacterium]
ARCVGGEFCLAGCTVAPGFDFADFEMGDRESLLELFPMHRELILAMTHGDEA